MYYEFSDHIDGLTVTIYKKPKEERMYEIKVEKKQVLVTLVDGGEQKKCAGKKNGEFVINLPGEVEFGKMTSDKYKVQVELVKKIRGRWGCINELHKRVASGETTEEPAIYSNTKSSHTSNHDDSQNPDDLFALLQNIYSQGDENIRRAMNKSLRESNGTVLSTDWESIKNNKPQNE